MGILTPMDTLAGGIALYLHIPFCQTKCSYCDFNTYAGVNDLIPAYVLALNTEVARWGRLLGGCPVATIFFGGGTPSLLAPSQLRSVMDSIRASFALMDQAEVTAEANPEDVTPEKMAGFLACGVNRLSMGTQTLDLALLKLLSRRHTAERAIEALGIAREAGFRNVNLDLMYGLPLQTMEHWRTTVGRVLDLRPEHLSAYCLTLEEGTPLHRWVTRGTLPGPDQDLAADMYSWTEEAMGRTGYRHYEISNWALPGMECRHNLVYWRNGPYLGLGPGAHSYLQGHRFATLLSPHEYLKRVEAWNALQPELGATLTETALRSIPTVAEVEAIGPGLEMAETAMLALRLDDGLDESAFAKRYGRTLQNAFPGVAEEMTGAGLLDHGGEQGRQRLVLTPRGRLLSNEVFQRLLARRPKDAALRPGGGHGKQA